MSTKAEVIHRIHKLSESLNDARKLLGPLCGLMRKGSPEIPAAQWKNMQSTVEELHRAVLNTAKLLPIARHLGGGYGGQVVGFDRHLASGTILLDEGTVVSFALTAFMGCRGMRRPHIGTPVKVVFQDHGEPGIVLAILAVEDSTEEDSTLLR